MTNASNATMDVNTVFVIGSNTKVFTAILLSDMVTNGLINLDDPIETYLHSNVTVPQYNGHKITIKDLATHTLGLSEFPDNYCTSFDPTKHRFRIQFNTAKICLTVPKTMILTNYI